MAEAGQLLYGAEAPQAQAWRVEHHTPLFQGQAAHIADELQLAAARERERHAEAARAEALDTAAGYFRENQRRMQYQELREDLWPIGSGVVESEAKQFKARFDGPGMSWSRPGFNALLPFRAAVMSGTFDRSGPLCALRNKCTQFNSNN